MTVKEWKRRVAELNCLICQAPANLHHVREGQGMSQRAKDWMVVPLCKTHHEVPDGIHNQRQFYLRFRMDEMDLLADTIAAVVRKL